MINTLLIIGGHEVAFLGPLGLVYAVSDGDGIALVGVLGATLVGMMGIMVSLTGRWISSLGRLNRSEHEAIVATLKEMANQIEEGKCSCTSEHKKRPRGDFSL